MDAAHETRALSVQKRIVLTVGSAVLVAVAFVAMTMARKNYDVLYAEFVVLELGVSLAASIAANFVHGLDERGAALAAQYAGNETGGLWHHVLSVLPSVAVRAAIITACLAAVNATVVTGGIYREEVTAPVLAVIIRFLADIPQALVICLVVRLAIDRMKEPRND
ncbi:MAG: hypothetical protein IKG11_04415 [Atopobiaceae bacterium]|nr:hypothetical protein [Atopobiaceae bacterium]MDO4403795.1 hypothetical protein [Atopobiaceae bacterium]